MAGTEHSYGREKLWQAVHCLATGSHSIQQRLEFATDYLIRLRPFDHALPERLHSELNSLLDDLTSMPAQGSEGTIAATMRAIGDLEAKKLAERILDLYVELHGGI